jgi:hypothetical protein
MPPRILLPVQLEGHGISTTVSFVARRGARQLGGENPDAALRARILEEFLGVPHCNEVVEIGIGTNDGIPGFVPSDILLNERFASFHLGVGSADAESAAQNLHLDFILGDCRILMGSHVALSKGTFARPTTAEIRHRRAYDVPVKLHDAV